MDSRKKVFFLTRSDVSASQMRRQPLDHTADSDLLPPACHSASYNLFQRPVTILYALSPIGLLLECSEASTRWQLFRKFDTDQLSRSDLQDHLELRDTTDLQKMASPDALATFKFLGI